jgi:DNA uptake protein ComE-like DNA-binding protein
MKKILRDYFSFNSRERVSILFLCCLIAFFWILPYWYPTPQKLPESLGWKAQPVDSENIVTKAPTIHTDSAHPAFPAPLFVFNPNDLPADGWKKLGLRDKTVQTILHYREKGGRFREPADLKKIWGISIAEANRLIPFVRMPELAKPVFKTPIERPKSIPISILINQATVAELLLIPGFSRPLAARMIRYRDKLGGFTNLEQIRKTYGLSDSLYQLMAPIVVL